MIIKPYGIPLLIKAFVFIYLGVYGIKSVVYGINYSNPFTDMLRLTLVAIFALFFAYGVICFIQDVRGGGIAKVITKIKEFLNGNN